MADTDAALKTMIANLEKNTGKSLSAWSTLAKNSGHGKHGELVKWLKSEHKMTHGDANLVAQESLSSVVSNAPQAEDLLAAMFGADKQALKPIYDALINSAQALGADVDIAPKKSYVALRRKKQFALLQPSTKTRLDLGLNLKGIEAQGPLEVSGSFSAMCTHRVRLESVADIKPEIQTWLAKAYEQAG